MSRLKQISTSLRDISTRLARKHRVKRIRTFGGERANKYVLDDAEKLAREIRNSAAMHMVLLNDKPYLLSLILIIGKTLQKLQPFYTL
jgi:hypothetical protein